MNFLMMHLIGQRTCQNFNVNLRGSITAKTSEIEHNV